MRNIIHFEKRIVLKHKKHLKENGEKYGIWEIEQHFVGTIV